MTPPAAARTLTVLEGIALTVGIVIGMGIFRSPPVVAGALGEPGWTMAAWALGGVVSVFGALTYAELATAYPGRAGEVGFLTRAYGPRVGFLFGWSRLTVIQTGTVAGAGFVAGDYLNALLPLGPQGSALYALGAVTLTSLINLAGLKPSARAQIMLSSVLVGCLAILAAAGFGFDAAAAPPPSSGGGMSAGALGAAMIFVLLTYGGWSEAAYLSGELPRPGRDPIIVLLGGVVLVTLSYLGVNWAYLRVLGVDGVAASTTVGADLAEALFGASGALIVTAFVLAAAVSTANGTLFTGGRSAAALGAQTPALAPLARWNPRRGAPTLAILAQTAIALALVGLGALAQQGFETMVAYTAPVFWSFFLLSGLSAIVLRRRDPARPRPFRIPLYPLPPLLFSAASAWMAWSSLSYAASLASGERAEGFAIGVAAGLCALLVGVVMAARLRFVAVETA